LLESSIRVYGFPNSGPASAISQTADFQRKSWSAEAFLCRAHE